MRPIDADALVEHLERMSNNYTEIYERLKAGDQSKAVIYGKFTAIVETMIDVKRMPTLDYAPVRHGELNHIEFLTCQCSECKRIFHELPCENYCPNCGAKMDGGKNDVRIPDKCVL